MRVRTQGGSIASVAVIGLLGLALFGALGFGFWANQGKADYQNNFDTKVASSVSEALAKQEEELGQKYNDEAKKPNKTFKGPVTYGSIVFEYPKTWSAYVDLSSSSQPINAYFHPNEVPGVSGQSDINYALRVELVDNVYSQVIQELSTGLKEGSVTANAFVPEKLKSIPNVQPGTRFDGAIEDKVDGAMVAIQTRDKTLKIYTQSKDYLNDFNNVVLPSLTFAP